MAGYIGDTSGTDEEDMAAGPAAKARSARSFGRSAPGGPRPSPALGRRPEASPSSAAAADGPGRFDAVTGWPGSAGSVADYLDAFDEPVTASARAIACVDVRTVPSDDDFPTLLPPSAVLAFALRRVQRAVRADDRICVAGGSRLAVAFGAGADVVPPQILAERLARAVGTQLRVAGSTVDLRVSVGIASGAADLEPAHIAGVAYRAGGVARRAVTAPPTEGRPSTPAAVAVAGLLEVKAPADLPASLRPRIPATAAEAPGGRADPLPRLHRRTVIGYSAQRLTHGATRPPPPLGDDAGRDDELTVLVIDPLPNTASTPGLASEAVASVVERHGSRAVLTAAGPAGELPAEVDEIDPDIVVLVLHSGTSGTRRRDPSTSSASSWSIPARLTAEFCAGGARVVAVGMGAGAAALAGCVEQGATALFDVEHLPEQLLTLQRGAPAGDAAATNGRPAASARMSGPFEALVQLTSSERRVLFHLTEGWGAQEIADQLVVSLTTVRSHIRSILRKLNVKSQLAAVAIANGLNLEDLTERDNPPATPSA